MQKITAIKQQEKRKDRYSIFVDGKYSFSLSESALLEQKLASGQTLDATQLRDFKKLSADDKAYSNALRYAAMRQRSRGELAEYLRRKAVAEPVAEGIITKLVTIGLVDDLVFAQSWVQHRAQLKPTSQRRLVQELKQKHISEDIIQQVIDQHAADEPATLRELIRKKRRQSKYQDDLKLMQYLARQGFQYQDIKDALGNA